MNGRGRPLRFVALVAAGWAGVRVTLLWPEGASLPEAIETAFPVRKVVAAVAPEAVGAKRVAAVAAVQAARALSRRSVAPVPSFAQPMPMAVAPESIPVEQVPGAPVGAMPPVADALPDMPQSPSRWSASAWAVTRRGGPAGGAMLGGDQAGLRVAYGVGRGQAVQLYARATAPLTVAGRELALGADWRPVKAVPVRVAAEYRVGLDGMRGGPAVAAVGGFDGAALPLDFSLEGYGQTGAVWRERLDPFADGALRATRRVVQAGKVLLHIGGGLWGAAQREAARVDIGPSAVATVPLGGQAVRIAVDWRERVAGSATPGSGPALSIGTDF